MSLVRVDTIKPITSSADLSLQGDNGGSAVDCLNITSAGDVDFSGNTDAKIKLPSAGGLYESDGTTPILTESGGAVTMQNVTAGSGVSGFGSGVTALLLDVKAQNTEGGTLNSGDWRDRDLNTEVFDVDSVVSISSDQFTLIAGTYIIEFGCPTMNVARTQTRLYNVTTTAAVAYGTSVYVHPTYPTTQWSVGWLRVVLSGATIYKLQTQVETSLATTGGGAAANFSSEHYSYVKIHS